MEDINFTSLAPRQGTRPLMGSWNEIGTNSMNGGAFSWSSLWSGLKSFGSTVKNYGTKAWNSSTGQMLRDKLKDSGVQQKIVEGISSGINGAVDIARQELERKLAQRLDVPPPPPPPTEVQVEDVPMVLPAERLPPSKGHLTDKRPRPDAEEIVIKSDEPPSYEEAVGSKAPPPPPLSPTPPPAYTLEPPTYPMTRPIAPMARPVRGPSTRPVVPPSAPPAPVVDIPTTLELRPPVVKPAPRPVAVATPAYSRARNWESTLSSIVGLGVRSLKRRRCY